jgi:hypothetical protein
MSTSQQPQCTHDRGPGTSVCFRCRYEAGLASRERLRKGAVWGAVLVIVIAALAAGGNAGASWWKLLRDEGKPTLEAATPPGATAPVVNARSASWAAESVRMVSLAPPPAPARAPMAPILVQGATTLRQGIEAVRRGDTVIVSFDNPQARTRRADKFDQLLRATLPRIYGALADSLLAAHPGKLVSDPRALVRELPTKGLSLAGTGEWRIVVWPETRPGQDGPLVIRYRTALAR